MIIRYCGTTKITSQKDALINSIVAQLESNFKFTVLKRNYMTLLDIFENALQEASKVTERKVIIIIDSLDQLESASRADLGKVKAFNN